MNFIRMYYTSFLIGLFVGAVSVFSGYPVFDKNGFYPLTFLVVVIAVETVQVVFDRIMESRR